MYTNYSSYIQKTHLRIHKKAHHQTEHFFSEFIGEPTGQLKSLANSGLLDSGPTTLNSLGV